VQIPTETKSAWATVAARLQAATLGEFEILTELGRGGMAAVYLARDLSLNRPVAIKIMAPGLLLGVAMVNRFRQEAVTVANLQHAHIVAIHAVRQVEDLHFFVMQFVPGRTIADVLRDKASLPLPVTLAWLYQIGSALGYAHRRGVIHRDVKPGNFLLNMEGEVVVTDFGIAKVTENPSLTQTGTVVGTPLYMSPEQCFARELTGASDQYSLAVVAYEMLAGHPPFSGSSFLVMRAHTEDEPPPLRSARPDVPAAVESALMRMLAKRPADRFPTMTDALAALGAGPLPPADPLHATLRELAAANERLEGLRDVLRTPASPIPKTRPRAKVDAVTPPAPMPATEAIVIAIDPPPRDLEPGASATLRATVKTGSGQPVTDTALAWESSEPAVGAVDRTTGVLTAVAPGRARISCVAGTIRESVDVVVTEPQPNRVEISVPPGPLMVGRTITLSATVTNRFGVPAPKPIEWSVDEPAIATIVRDTQEPDAGSILIRGVAPGTTGISASCGGVRARGMLRFVAAPAVAAPPTPLGPNAASVPPANLSSPPKPPLKATVVVAPIPQPTSDETLVVSTRTPAAKEGKAGNEPESFQRPLAVGAVGAAASEQAPSATASREATTGSRTRWRWAVVAVPLLGVAAFALVRSGLLTDRLQEAAPKQPDATASKAADSSQPRAAAPTPATPSPAVPPVVAASVDTAPPAVSPPPKAPASVPVASRLLLRPSRTDAILPGDTVHIAAIVHDGSGRTMRGAVVKWTSSSPSIATVDASTGTVRAVAEGSARITARSGDVSQELTVSVNAPPPNPAVVTSVELGEIAPLTAGESVRLAATAKNAYGNAAPGATIEWSSSNPEVASIATGGLLTARAAGSATIRASSGDRSAERRVTVRAREVPVAKADTPAAPPPKTEAELGTEIRSVLARYTRGIETRDTSLMRSVFPSAPGELLRNWQVTFNDARDGIQLRGAGVELLDSPRDAVGNQVRARGQFAAHFYSKDNRRDTQLNASFTAVVQRTTTGWRIVSIR
jgi:uncharacterized protein YjdB